MTSFIGPIVGVVDGSYAAPGEVGEFLSAIVNGIVAVAPNNVATVGALNLPPGDWMIDLYVRAYSNTGGIYVELTPTPIGARGAVGQLINMNLSTVTVGLDFPDLSVSGPSIQISNAVSQMLTYKIIVNVYPAASSDVNHVVGQASWTLIVSARRMR